MSTVQVPFETWYSASHARVMATLVMVTGDLDRASDATDEAFLRALARWSTVSEMTSPLGWTIQVGVNVARRRQRRRAIEERLLRRHHIPALLDGPAGEAWLAVRDLPSRQRETLVLRYVADMTEPEIAKALGISRSAVSSALTDGRRRLAELLGDQPEEVLHVRHA